MLQYGKDGHEVLHEASELYMGYITFLRHRYDEILLHIGDNNCRVMIIKYMFDIHMGLPMFVCIMNMENHELFL